ncbi:adenylyltransferase, putative [Syntrophotalea carbinolica DSM 2380]|uniref:Adenylyltransferase, putative n=1 Tax=Syntrophotalea carbinolica (strain DSM 2380 / NBRC 103641 / GraBd1) TaxID=338963 RepID=Q3A3W1_SYNC1|nr:phenylacetate--CoA ligase family protein [Syntrophotalea carbinolica]ABA88946.1 adenylyltransferase, putative [Syntrophotalea carbinolica DSM 2380]
MKIIRDSYYGSAIYLLFKWAAVKNAENFDRRHIEALQTARLKRLLKHTLTHSNFYKDFYKSHGITLDHIATVNLSDLPIMTKKIMMDNFDSVVCDSRLKRKELEKFVANPINHGKKFQGRFQVVHSSGSSGTLGIFIYGPKDWTTLKALTLSRATKTKINPLRKQKLAFIGVVDGHYAGISLAQAAPPFLFDLLPLDINSPLEKALARLNAFQPDFLGGYASGVGLLAQAQTEGKLDIHPKGIMCSADPLTPRISKAIKQAFGIDPVNLYAASESIGIAAQCSAQHNMHVFDDWHCIEVLDNNLNPTKNGEFGNLVLTNLYNYTQPLIRYQMNDELALDERPCGCKWPFPTIKEIAGREEDFLWFQRADDNLDFIHPVVFVEFMVPGLVGMQVVQTDRNRLLIKAIISGDEKDTITLIRNRMDAILRRKQLDNMVVFDVELVSEIGNDPKTGKYKLIIPLKDKSADSMDGLG